MSSMSGMHAHAGASAASTMWMPAPGQTWLGAWVAFVAMWAVMMAPMMAPSVAPTLWRYRQTIRAAGEKGSGSLTAIVAAGYFLVWIVFGAAVFPLGGALESVATRVVPLARIQPLAIGAALVFAVVLQFTAWRVRHLDLCRPEHGRIARADAGAAWRHGLCLGWHCVCACAGLTAVLLVAGSMNPRVMLLAALAVAAERLTGPF
jgi:predicted metal-binding membrane protein